MRILILGGSSEASALCRALATAVPKLDVTYSLAGVTKSPLLPEGIKTRIGGFGGIAGLVAWLKNHDIDYVIDATHPFAIQMTHHAWEACLRLSLPYMRISRPAWQPTQIDQWRHVSSIEQAACLLGQQQVGAGHILLTIGRKELAFFKEHAPQHNYVVRLVDRPEPSFLPPKAIVLTARGPFSLEEERAMFKKYQITHLVTKNSGGNDTYAKLISARENLCPVIIIDRPAQSPDLDAFTVESWKDALALICNPLHS